MLNGNTVPLPRREIDAGKLPGTVGATVPAPRGRLNRTPTSRRPRT